MERRNRTGLVLAPTSSSAMVPSADWCRMRLILTRLGPSGAGWRRSWLGRLGRDRGTGCGSGPFLHFFGRVFAGIHDDGPGVFVLGDRVGSLLVETHQVVLAWAGTPPVAFLSSEPFLDSKLGVSEGALDLIGAGGRVTSLSFNFNLDASKGGLIPAQTHSMGHTAGMWELPQVILIRAGRNSLDGSPQLASLAESEVAGTGVHGVARIV